MKDARDKGNTGEGGGPDKGDGGGTDPGEIKLHTFGKIE
jgi:hypothetical protein